MTRPLWTLVHRYAGLAMALFVSVAGLTGSLMAFTPELERAISPHLFPGAAPGAQRLGMGELLLRAEKLVPQARSDGVYLGDAERARVNMSPRTDPATGQPYDIGFNELFLNPYTGQELGRNTWGAISQGWHNFMPLVLEIHSSLVLGTVGIWIFGIAALVWTIDCFVAIYLTLPLRRLRPASPGPAEATAAGRSPRRSFWQRWKPAWQIKYPSSTYRLQFDLHRAGGLWLWAMLFVFAWSGVYMNLGREIYHPVMSRLFDMKTPDNALPALALPLETPRLGWKQAQRTAEQLMTQQAAQRGFSVGEPVRMYLDRERGVYFYDVRTSLDFQDRRSATTVYFDADTGQLKLLLLPHGQYSGNTVSNWLLAMHEANVFGLPFRVFVAVLGLAIVALSVTGVYLWWKKRRARSGRA